MHSSLHIAVMKRLKSQLPTLISNTTYGGDTLEFFELYLNEILE